MFGGGVSSMSPFAGASQGGDAAGGHPGGLDAGRQLARAASHPEDDDLMWSDKLNHISERWPDKVGLELQNVCFPSYLIAENLWVPFVAHSVDGPVWTCERHPDNARGDSATLLQRKDILSCMLI